MAHSEESLSDIVDLLASIAPPSEQGKALEQGKASRNGERKIENSFLTCDAATERVLIIGAGRMCEPAVNYLAHHGLGVTVASLFLQDAVKATQGIPNTTAVQIDVSDKAHLLTLISKASVVISLLPPNVHVPIANCCVEVGRHLVTASYVSAEMSALDGKAKEANVSLLCEMGLDPGIDHMIAMKMINAVDRPAGKIKSFISYCGGLPAPACADNPLGYKFSWNPAGAIKAGRNPAIYKDEDKIIRVPGDELFSSAVPLQLPELPALERFPNRDSLQYGDLYGISDEASTIFRATLRYEGYCDILDSLAKLGYFDTEPCPLLQNHGFSAPSRSSYRALFEDLILQIQKKKRLGDDGSSVAEHAKNDPEVFCRLGCCKSQSSAQRVSVCIRHLGLDGEEEIPASCKSAFEALCSKMEQKLTYAPNEQDMVLLHHEIEIQYNDGRPSERHVATLLEFGDVGMGSTDPFRKPHSAMARTVGLPVAIGAQLLLRRNIKSRGVLRPLHPEIYVPVLNVLESMGVHIKEHVDHV